MLPWSEVYADLRTLWITYWSLRKQGCQSKLLPTAIQRVTREIVLRDQRIRELEQQLRELRKLASNVADETSGPSFGGTWALEGSGDELTRLQAMLKKLKKDEES